MNFYIKTGSILNLLIAITAAFCMFCTENEDFWISDNKFDSLGVNWNPPVVHAMADTTISIYDNVKLHASAEDPNGEVQWYYWIQPGKNPVVTSDSTWSHTFNVAKREIIIVYVTDDDDIKSKPDTIRINVLLNAPRVEIFPQDTIIGIMDTLKVKVKGEDVNGFIEGYSWALDGESFGKITKDSVVFVSYSLIGQKKILVKTIDDDSIYSEADTLTITVKNFYIPELLSPDSNSVVSSIDINLNWKPGLYKEFFTVYLDTVENPSVIIKDSVKDTFCVVPFKLDYYQTYYWRVEGVDTNQNIATSTTWKFMGPMEPNVAPKFITEPKDLPDTVDVGEYFIFTLQAKDDNTRPKDSLSFTVQQPVSGLTVTDSVIRWTPNESFIGAQTISFIVSDGRGGSDVLVWSTYVKFNINSNAKLFKITLSDGHLEPSFDKDHFYYIGRVTKKHVSVTPVAMNPKSKIIINSIVVQSGTSVEIEVTSTINFIPMVIEVTSENGINQEIYTINFIRL